MNFKYAKWKLITDRLYTSMVVAHPTWYVIAEEIPFSLISGVEEKLESYEF